MKVSTRDNEVDADFRFLYVHDGKIRSEGTYAPQPSWEGKAWLALDFHEAKLLHEELTRVLPELACPACDRKGEAKTMEGFIYSSGLGRVRLVPALDGVACACPADVDQELVKRLEAGEVPMQLRLLPRSILAVASCLASLEYAKALPK